MEKQFIVMFWWWRHEGGGAEVHGSPRVYGLFTKEEADALATKFNNRPHEEYVGRKLTPHAETHKVSPEVGMVILKTYGVVS